MKKSFDAKRTLFLLEQIAGEPPLEIENQKDLIRFLSSHKGGLGYSQMNELLLASGYDKISPQFFDFLCLGKLNPAANSKLNSTDHLEEGVDRFLKLALYAFGNVKFAYKRFARDPDALAQWIDLLTPVTDTRYVHRLDPALQIKDIPAADRYYLGYLVKRELDAKLHADPGNHTLKAQLKKREQIVETGKANQVAYLTSDYLDVYVATSMRQQHEYVAVAELTKAVFSHKQVRDLNLRYFDPTLAYCADRIDKGLSEALMLKRAKCTLFLAQESDTLGKDSELACTLAQGKPVIAYVPSGDDKFVTELLRSLEVTYPTVSRKDLVLAQLRVFNGDLAWTDRRTRGWLDGMECEENELMKVFKKAVKDHYDRRANTLRDSHPLGIQVHLQTGVAVGVLVVRSIADCAALIRRIMLGEYVFKVDEVSGGSHLALREEISDSIFRVMTRDKALTHTFWNFYLR